MNSKKLYYSILFALSAFLFTASFKPIPQTGTTKVAIVTDFGTIIIKLYNETPLHRDNFVKLIRQHYFDTLTFNRIIQNFVIQGGDPDPEIDTSHSKNVSSAHYPTIPAEMNQQFFHKKGALAASRKSDFENPEMASSSAQFYIVQGVVYKEEMLQLPAKRITKMKLFNEIIHRPENESVLKRYAHYSKNEDLDSLRSIQEIIMKKVETELPKAKPYTFSGEQIKAYTTIGGTPHLDDSYTVFGEVMEGLDVIDKIAKQSTYKNGMPINKIRMKISIIE